MLGSLLKLILLPPRPLWTLLNAGVVVGDNVKDSNDKRSLKKSRICCTIRSIATGIIKKINQNQ